MQYSRHIGVLFLEDVEKSIGIVFIGNQGFAAIPETGGLKYALKCMNLRHTVLLASCNGENDENLCILSLLTVKIMKKGSLLLLEHLIYKY